MSEQINDGGPAFPVNFMDFQPGTGAQVVRDQCSGITVRDLFAGEAMGAMIERGIVLDNRDVEVISRSAYEMADAMLKERSKV